MASPSLFAFILMACVFTASSAASAAEFQVVHATLWQDEPGYDEELEEPRCNVIMRGEIQSGDLERLRSAYRTAQRGRKMTPSYLCLDSPGGRISEALAVINWLMKGEGIGIATVVDSGAACLSACALIFLSGSRIDHNVGGYAPQVERWLHARGRLGFHAPYLAVSALPDRRISREEAITFYQAAQETTKKIISTFQHREVRDSNLPGRADWTRTSLFYELMLKGPNEFIFIDTIDAAGRWGIDIFGAKRVHLDIVNDEMARMTCRNLIAWADDRFSADDEFFFDGKITSRKAKPGKKGEYAAKEFVVLVSSRHKEECELSIGADGESGIVNGTGASFLVEGTLLSSRSGPWWSILPASTKLTTLPSMKIGGDGRKYDRSGAGRGTR